MSQSKISDFKIVILGNLIALLHLLIHILFVNLAKFASICVESTKKLNKVLREVSFRVILEKNIVF